MIICRILDLSFNRLRKIQNIDHLVKLRKLYLCDNKISKIENISTLTELVSLELGANRIRVGQSSSHLSNVHSHDMRYTMCISKVFSHSMMITYHLLPPATNRACLCSKLPSHYFPISTNHPAVLLTECRTTNRILT